MDHKYLYLEYDDGIHLDPLETMILIIIFSALIIVPTYIVADYKAYKRGLENGVSRVEQAMHQAVIEGRPIAFINNDVKLVYTVKTDNKAFRGKIKEMADRYELVKYRIKEEFGPDDNLKEEALVEL